MEEIFDLLVRPVIKVLLWIVKGLQFLAWDLAFSYVGWSIGWLFLRMVTLGRFPKENLRELENVSFPKSLFVEMTGLLVLSTLFYTFKVFLNI